MSTNIKDPQAGGSAGSGYPVITLIELIERNPAFKDVKKELDRHEKGSFSYYKALFESFPLHEHGLADKPQSVPVTKKDPNGEYSQVYRNICSPDALVTCIDQNWNTGYNIYNMSVKMYPDRKCLGERPYDAATGTWGEEYVWETFSEVQQRALNFGSGVLSIVNMRRGRPRASNDFIVGIMAPNRKEWVITDLACQSYSLTSTALYDTLGPNTSEYIMNLTESPVVVVNKENVFKIIGLANKLPNLNTIILMDNLDASELAHLNQTVLGKKTNEKGERVAIFSFRQIEHIGEVNRIPPIPPTPESVYTINFTSGTTALPKGVELTHKNMAAAFAFSNVATEFTAEQRYYMSFLPLAHIFERETLIILLGVGVAMGFLHKPDPAVLIEDSKILRPFKFALVPRVLSKLEGAIKKKLLSSETPYITKNIASTILDAKMKKIKSSDKEDDSLINTLVYRKLLINKIREELGFARTTHVITGSAPISPSTMNFLRSALDVSIQNGYGLTECYAGAFVSRAHESDCGSVGPPGIACEFRLKSVPEMNYDAVNDLKGEVQLRGPQTMNGYYKNPKQTSKALDSEGWFSTGDIGMIDAKGRLWIIDRIKHMFKLSQGEYIVTEKIETQYVTSCPMITQIFVHGNIFSTFLVGIIGIDPILLKSALDSVAPGFGSISASELPRRVNEDLNLKKTVLKILNSAVRDLQGFEKLGNIYVDIEPLSMENGTLTPTFKAKRAECSKIFGSIINELYSQGNISKPDKL
ncbi:HDR044Cp [Eremothecium sinecaudum]|uniref:HDR044Cp n=1 Tax=Eremothecium sinecaudum TaxID=45286 RepID=A0A0X8HS08_9SACH|nr:HDR044Cp [Eremothecium sinecaudum]AMD20786.1 HDR044Cp [Eremothecium sinecaudum]